MDQGRHTYIVAHSTGSQGTLKIIYYYDNDLRLVFKNNMDTVTSLEQRNKIKTILDDHLNFGQPAADDSHSLPVAPPPVLPPPLFQPPVAPPQHDDGQAAPEPLMLAKRTHKAKIVHYIAAFVLITISLCPLSTSFWLEIPFSWAAFFKEAGKVFVLYTVHQWKIEYNRRYINTMMVGGLERIMALNALWMVVFALATKFLHFMDLPTPGVWGWTMIELAIFACNSFGLGFGGF